MITFHQDCIVYEVGRDLYGKPIKKSEQQLKCRVKEKYQLVKNQAAQEVISNLEFTLPSDAVIESVDDYFIEYEEVEHTIISVKTVRNTIGEVVKKVIYT